MTFTAGDNVRLSYIRSLASESTVEAEQVRAYRDYYDGEHPTYLSERQKEFLGLRLSYQFADNYCAPVVDIAAERLEVQAFDGGDEEAGAEIAALAWQWWSDNRMDARQDGLHGAALRDGAAYLIVNWSAEDEGPTWTINYAYDGTRGVKIHRHPDTGDVLYASKRWHEDNADDPLRAGTPRLTLYFPDRVEKYRASKSAGGWTLIEEIDWRDGTGRPLGMAVIPFENPGGSELKDVLPLQDMLNKTLLDLVAAADSDGFGILYASGVQAQIDPTTGEEQELTIGPGRLIRMSDPQARMGRVAPDDLTRLIRAADFWKVEIAAISRTPQYLLQRWEGQPPSGESLKVQESGLVSKTERTQGVFGNFYEDAILLSARLANEFGDYDLALESVNLSTVWKPAAVRDERDHWEVLQKKRAAGVPDQQIWREGGYDQSQVAEFERTKQADRDRAIGQMAQQVIRGNNGEQ